MSEALLDSENPDELLGGRYLPVREIGSGGSGTVYEAVHHLTRERVAVKVIMLKGLSSNKRVVARFMREAKLSHQIQSDGVVRVTDAWIDSQKRCCLVMELLRGMSLREVIHSGRVARGQVVRWLIEALDPLEAAHRASIIHRDLKPENIYIHIPPLPEGDTLVTAEPLFLDETRGELRPLSERSSQSSVSSLDDGLESGFDSTESDFTLDVTDVELIKTWSRAQVKLLDFGLSRSFISPTVTQTGHFVGTPWYMSPEQIFLPKTCTHVTDLWSMGVMLYEALNDDVPFTGGSMPELCLAVRDQDVPPLSKVKPGLPPELLWCVDQCLNKDPKQRIRSAAKLKYHLEQAFQVFKDHPIAQEVVSGSLFKTPSTGPSLAQNTLEASSVGVTSPPRTLSTDLTQPQHEPAQFYPESIEPDPDLSAQALSQVDTRRDHHLSDHQRYELLQLAGQFNSETARPSEIPSKSLESDLPRDVDQRETLRLDPSALRDHIALADERGLPQTAELTSGLIFEALAAIDQDEHLEREPGDAPEIDDDLPLTQRYTSNTPNIPKFIRPDSTSVDSDEFEQIHKIASAPAPHDSLVIPKFDGSVPFTEIETPVTFDDFEYNTGTTLPIHPDRSHEPRRESQPRPKLSLFWVIVLLFCFGIGVGLFIRSLGLV